MRQLQAAFAAAWAEATGILFSGRATLDSAEDGHVSAGLLYATPTMGTTAAERFIALSIGGATKTLYLTNAYFVPDDSFVALLSEAAKRGVDVRILTAGETTDVRIVRIAGRAQYEALLSAGVRIYEWQPTVIHAKTFVVDGLWSTVGSMNFDNRSLVLNDESTLMILDAETGTQMNAIFLDDLRNSIEISPESFRQRPWTNHLVEFGASLVARVL